MALIRSGTGCGENYFRNYTLFQRKYQERVVSRKIIGISAIRWIKDSGCTSGALPEGDSGRERARYTPSTAIKTKVDEPRNVDRG